MPSPLPTILGFYVAADPRIAAAEIRAYNDTPGHTMSHTPLTIYCNARFSEDATQLLTSSILAPHRLVLSQSQLQSNLTAPQTDGRARDADVIFGQPPPDDVIRADRVRWVHLHSAG